MITLDAVRELAEYESPNGCALTFYYQPSTPKDQSHREEAILLKDLVKKAVREAEKNGSDTQCAKDDVERILEMADRLHGNGGQAKVIFADAANGFWREFDLPARLERTQVFLNRRFQLRPLAPMLEQNPKVCVVLVDRTKARLFEYNMGSVREIADFFNELPRKGESEGFGGFDGGHGERNQAEIAKQHYKFVDDVLVKMFDRGGWEAIVFGCREENWNEIRDVLHTYVTDRLLGRFKIDPASASPNAIVDGVERLLNERQSSMKQELLRDVIGEAHRNGNGALGLKRVLKSLERGEIQALVLGDRFSASGSECRNCGHIEMGHNTLCELCGQEMKQVDELSDALINSAIRNGAEVVFIRGDQQLEQAGHIAALLRFRADQNTPMKLAS